MSDWKIDAHGLSPLAISSDQDFMERALSRDRTIEPSREFRIEVMSRVRAEATMPPLRFPWKRFMAGVGLAAGAVVAYVTGSDPSVAKAVDASLLMPALMLVIVAARLSAGWRIKASIPRTAEP